MIAYPAYRQMQTNNEIRSPSGHSCCRSTGSCFLQALDPRHARIHVVYSRCL